MQDRRREPRSPHATFGTLARGAIERLVPETRISTATWHARPNHVWVRWPADGGWRYLALLRHLDWITAEAGYSGGPAEFDTLALHPDAPGAAPGRRARLGDLLGEGDRWWRAGTREAEMVQRLEWLVLQCATKAPMFFARSLREERHER